jgi:hypothetical protein
MTVLHTPLQVMASSVDGMLDIRWLGGRAYRITAYGRVGRVEQDASGARQAALVAVLLWREATNTGMEPRGDVRLPSKRGTR